MAGISFELKRILEDNKLTSLFLSFTYSISLSAGPWIISILAIIFAGIIASKSSNNPEVVRQYQVVITYITAISLIVSGPLQLLFSRYISDRLFEKEVWRVLPNFIGALTVSMALGFLVGLLIVLFGMKKLPPTFALLFLFSLTLSSGFWIVNVLLTSLKSYKYILFAFFIGFGSMMITAPIFSKAGITGLLFSFFVGMGIAFSLLVGYIFYSYTSSKLIEFDFLNLKKIYLSLAVSGLFYNLGIWIDKFVFWFSPLTGQQVIGPFKASPVYDIPIFLAYLSIAPGMGIFFLKLEAEFAEYYDRYYSAVREGATLERIYEMGYELVMAVRGLIQEVFRIQGMAVIIVLLTEKEVFKWFNLSPLYLPLFNILLLGTSLQLLVMCILALLFYFDLRKEAVYLTISFAILNFLLSIISIKLGPYFYGYGFFLSLLITFLFGTYLLRRFLYELHYRTFMLI
ncbi:MAG: exopolysaccharide Pel transporter PelG [Desulfurobacteriaceae bacterium]